MTAGGEVFLVFQEIRQLEVYFGTSLILQAGTLRTLQTFQEFIILRSRWNLQLHSSFQFGNNRLLDSHVIDTFATVLGPCS